MSFPTLIITEKQIQGPGEIAQWLGAASALAEDGSQLSLTLVPGDLKLSSGPHRHQAFA